MFKKLLFVCIVILTLSSCFGCTNSTSKFAGIIPEWGMNPNEVEANQTESTVSDDTKNSESTEQSVSKDEETNESEKNLTVTTEGFRNAKWGMSMEEIKACETEELVQTVDDSLYFQNSKKIFGCENTFCYACENGFDFCMYMFDTDLYGSDEECIIKANKISTDIIDYISEIYGAPEYYEISSTDGSANAVWELDWLISEVYIQTEVSDGDSYLIGSIGFSKF